MRVHRGGRIAAGDIEEAERPAHALDEDPTQAGVGFPVEQVVLVDQRAVDPPRLLEDGLRRRGAPVARHGA
jgi:hypothetical protein